MCMCVTLCERLYLTQCEIADNNMYRCQPHEVTTEDGYKLQLHRIPGAKAGGPLKGQTCFLMHGLMGSSAHWVMMGVDQGLAYYLCRMGCDVWLGNNRGNRYSRGHIKHNADDKATADYWDFSFHEMGRYDLPAMIDYISDATGQQRMHYVGHSQGCSQFAAMCDMRPEFASRIKSVHFMGPAIYLGQTSMQLKKFLSSYLVSGYTPEGVNRETTLKQMYDRDVFLFAFHSQLGLSPEVIGNFSRMLSWFRKLSELHAVSQGSRSHCAAMCCTL